MADPPPLPDTVEPPDPELDVSLLPPQLTTIIPTTRPEAIQTSVFREFTPIAFSPFCWNPPVGATDARRPSKKPGSCPGSRVAGSRASGHVARRAGAMNRGIAAPLRLRGHAPRWKSASTPRRCDYSYAKPAGGSGPCIFAPLASLVFAHRSWRSDVAAAAPRAAAEEPPTREGRTAPGAGRAPAGRWVPGRRVEGSALAVGPPPRAGRRALELVGRPRRAAATDRLPWPERTGVWLAQTRAEGRAEARTEARAEVLALVALGTAPAVAALPAVPPAVPAAEARPRAPRARS